MPTTKKTTTKKTTAAKPRVTKPKAHKEVKAKVEHVEEAVTTQPAETKVHLPKDGKYIYSVGRRKTAVANVRLFYTHGKNQINSKDFNTYFGAALFIDQALKPLQLTGLEKQVHVYVHANGGGLHSQAQAVAHGIATALAKALPDFRKVLKKNGMLTRDSRMKERKKPGLKRARRGPQWAKR